MDDVLEQYMVSILKFENNGFIDEAIQLCDNLLDIYHDSAENILVEKAMLEFRNMRDKEALLDFVRAYSIGQNIEIYNLVLEAYLEPNLKELQKSYYENMKILRGHPHYKNDSDKEEIDIYVLWKDEEILCSVNVKEKIFNVVNRTNRFKMEQKPEAFAVLNTLWIDDIFYYKDKAKDENGKFDKEIPCYLVFDINCWVQFIQSENLGDLVKEKNIIFIVGEQCFVEYFEDDTSIIPYCVVNDKPSKGFMQIIDVILDKKDKLLQENQSKIELYYSENKTEIIKRIRSKKPRILFWTSRYTTVLQHHTKDCMWAAELIGCEVELLIEPDNVHTITRGEAIKRICQFKPDIIFCIDYFRFEYALIPNEIIWLTWIQDFMPNIISPETPEKLGENDFILNHYISGTLIKDVGYNPNKVMPAPICANSRIYKPYALTKEEKQKYGADICMVCHAVEVEPLIQQMVDLCEGYEVIQKLVKEFLLEYTKLIKEKEKIYYNKKELIDFFIQFAHQLFHLEIDFELAEDLISRMYISIPERAYRQSIADALIAAGYTNLKLWGNGWLNIDRYKQYAMGPAENGEVLSKILRSSKIVLGNNAFGTGAARAWETMLSGGFYMSNYVPDVTDVVNIGSIMKVDEELVVFHNHKDMLEKIDYYLSHEEERRRMAEIGRQCALERMTYDALVKNMLDFLQEKL